MSNDDVLKHSLARKVMADDSSAVTTEELIWYWGNQFRSVVGQATLDKLERLQSLEAR